MYLRIHQEVQTLQNTECSIGLRSLTDAADWREGVGNQWLDTLLPVWMQRLSNRVEFENVTVSDVVPGTEPDVEIEPSGPTEGEIDSRPLPGHTALIIGWRTDVSGRAGRGRIYLSGLPVSSVGDATQCRFEWSDWLTELGEAHLTMFGPGGVSGLAEIVVISRTLDGVTRPVPIGIPVTAVYCVPFWATQRTRLPFRHS